MHGARQVGAAVARLVAAVVLMATLVFLIPRLAPGDPLDQLVGDDSVLVNDPDLRRQVADRYGLDDPLPVQYARFLGGAATGDLGWSFSRHDEVTAVLWARAGWTLLLVLPAVAVSTAIGLAAGVSAAWHHGGPVDVGLRSAFSVLRSVPDYVVATVVLLAFAVRFRWFPLAGARTPFSGSTGLAAAGDIARHAVLPVTALTLALVGAKFIVARAAVVDVRRQEFLTAARAHGLPRWRIRHLRSARHALAPVVQQVGAQVALAIAAAVFVERTFAYPGLGSLTFEAVGARDYPLLDGCFLTLGVITLLANVAVDAVVRRLDPWGGR